MSRIIRGMYHNTKIHDALDALLALYLIYWTIWTHLSYQASHQKKPSNQSHRPHIHSSSTYHQAIM
jgi:hypothetical protein